MRHGMAVTAAAEDAVRRIAKRYQKYVGAVVAVDMAGSGRHATGGLLSTQYGMRAWTRFRCTARKRQ